MRLTEIYTSTQGEGPGVGELTQFIRFAGCNLRCAGWPCDTPFAIDPAKYRDKWYDRNPAQIMEELSRHPKQVTLTGGEPFLQHSAHLVTLYDSLKANGYFTEVFTNGTRPFPTWIQNENVRVIMDWKLDGSGEDAEDPIRIDNVKKLKPKDAIKFVCADESDFIQAVNLYNRYLGFPYDDPHLYVGAVWGKVQEGEVVEWLKKMKVPFKLNVQVHNYLWPPHERRR
jgi:7-carboxy-7-deazaguanine synthase